MPRKPTPKTKAAAKPQATVILDDPTKLDAALVEVSEAVTALDGALQVLRGTKSVSIRADKIGITAAVEEAFARLRRARVALADLKAAAQ